MQHYDFFISYNSSNKDFANELVRILEENGTRCFIAPRNIPGGREYAEVIISAIANCEVVILVHSEKSDKSPYVRSEINSAVSRGKPIIPLRVEQFEMTPPMEFYLGTSQWIDAFPKFTDENLQEILARLEREKEEEPEIKESRVAAKTVTRGVSLKKVSEIMDCGFKPEEITMREIEIDFECTAHTKYKLTEELEGTVEDWIDALAIEEETSAILYKGNEIIGYCDAYPVDELDYDIVAGGKEMMSDERIAIFVFGGHFDLFIPSFMIVPSEGNQRNYAIIIEWLMKHIAQWEKDGIVINRIAVESYSETLEKILILFGFKKVGNSPANGEIYATTLKELKANSIVVRKYPFD